jgi:hypothetical protein
METANFYKLLNQQNSYNNSETDELLKIQAEYPYFQLAAMLGLKAAKQNKPDEYNSLLSKVATKVVNREVLFDFIYPEYNTRTVVPKDAKIVKTETKEAKILSNKSTASANKPIEAKEVQAPKPIKTSSNKEIKSKEELMSEVKARLKEIKSEEKPIDKASTPKVKDVKSKAILEKDSKENTSATAKAKSIKHAPLTKAKKEVKTVDRGSSLKIIESFIKTNPSINRPENKSYNEEITLANKSLEESYELVSETMAELFVKQGHNKKAIKVYEKLILIYPEKSTYFAARILKLKN